MNKQAGQLLRYVLNFSMIILAQSLVFTILLHEEHYPWAEELLQAFTLCFIFNLIAFGVSIVLFKWIFRRASFVVKATGTALLNTGTYFIPVAFTYMGTHLQYKPVIILVCFTGSFLIPFIGQFLFRSMRSHDAGKIHGRYITISHPKARTWYRSARYFYPFFGVV